MRRMMASAVVRCGVNELKADIALSRVVAQVIVVVADEDVEDHSAEQLLAVCANEAGVDVLAQRQRQVSVTL